jgi:hypothetical protein
LPYAIFYQTQNDFETGSLPAEVRGKGEYGPGIRALIPILKAEGTMSKKRILGFFQNFGIEVSVAYISQQWTGGYNHFHLEKSDLYRSGIAASDYAQIDWQVLELPLVPFYNNTAELGARVQARVRDVSFQTRSENGTLIKDTFMTINQTAKKLSVSFYDYVYARVSGQFELPSLAKFITQNTQTMPV